MARPGDPYRGFRFRVEFDQVQHGGFTRVKGLSRETKYESYREGGVNDHEHKLATIIHLSRHGSYSKAIIQNVSTHTPRVLRH